MINPFGFIYVEERAKNGDLDVQQRLRPKRASALSSGFDLASASREPIILRKGERTLVPTGIALCIAGGFEAQVRPRSGLAIKHGITVLNAPGTIDADYTGEVKVILVNHSSEDFVIDFGMRIAQLVIAKVETLDLALLTELKETERGEQGFGTSGIH